MNSDELKINEEVDAELDKLDNDSQDEQDKNTSD